MWVLLWGNTAVKTKSSIVLPKGADDLDQSFENSMPRVFSKPTEILVESN